MLYATTYVTRSVIYHHAVLHDLVFFIVVLYTLGMTGFLCAAFFHPVGGQSVSVGDACHWTLWVRGGQFLCDC